MSDEPPRPVITALETEPHYVLGFPAYAAMTIGVAPQGAGHYALPNVETHHLRGAVGLRLFRPGEAEPFSTLEPNALIDPDHARPGMRLQPDEARRFLIDIAPLWPEGIAPGAYDAELLYGTRDQVAQSPRFALQLRAPAQPEQQTLDALGPELARAGSWSTWIESRPANAAALQPPQDARDPLRYPHALRYMLYGPVPLGRIDPAFLSVLDGVFAPDAELFRAQLLAARDEAAFQAHARALLARWPALAAAIQAIAEGTSEIAWTRSQG